LSVVNTFFNDAHTSVKRISVFRDVCEPSIYWNNIIFTLKLDKIHLKNLEIKKWFFNSLKSRKETKKQGKQTALIHLKVSLLSVIKTHLSPELRFLTRVKKRSELIKTLRNL
jgi:hypothetical protein